MYQLLWGFKVEEKLYLGVREQKRLNTTGLGNTYLYMFYLPPFSAFSLYTLMFRNSVVECNESSITCYVLYSICMKFTDVEKVTSVCSTLRCRKHCPSSCGHIVYVMQCIAYTWTTNGNVRS